MAIPEFTTLDDVLAMLRLAAGDRDEDRLEKAVTEANSAVFTALGWAATDDRYTPGTDAYDEAWPVFSGAALTVACDLYRRPAAPGGVTDQYSGLGPVFLARDPLAGVWALIGPHANHLAQIGL